METPKYRHLAPSVSDLSAMGEEVEQKVSAFVGVRSSSGGRDKEEAIIFRLRTAIQLGAWGKESTIVRTGG